MQNNCLKIRLVQAADFEEWLRMRRALWPDSTDKDLQTEMQETLGGAETMTAFVAERPDGGFCGLLEASFPRE